MMPEITFDPLSAAIAQLGAKTPIAAALKSDEWKRIPLALRQRAQFSARLENVNVLQTIQDKLQKAIGLQREKVAGGEAFVDRSSFIGDMRQVMLDAGLSDGTSQRVTDLASRDRLGLIYDMQTRQAQEFSRRKVDMDPDILNEWPAQELIRVEERKEPRDWRRRWIEAGGKLIDGERMVALKTDDIWMNISEFGTPWPPFDFGSGMGLVDLDREDAVSLGLLTMTDTLEPSQDGFNDELEASVRDLDPELISLLQRAFGDQVEIVDGTAKWVGQV